MKKALFLALAAGMAISAFAQSNFTIVKPSEGARVRETVRLLFPKASLNKDNYVGIYLNGKFLEAVVPTMGANYAFFDLDTKARGIVDGPLAIETVLYQDFADRPRIIDRSSVNVVVGNSASIDIPASGLDLRYRFRAGTSWTYTLRNRMAASNLSEFSAGTARSESLLAGAPEEKIRIQYSIDDAYGDGDGLVRMQALPRKGQDNAVFSTSGNPVPTRYYDHQMAPVYLRVNNKGIEEWGSIPRYFPLNGTSGEIFRTDLYGSIPLPVLPSRPIRPESPATRTWSAFFQLGSLDLDKADEATSVTTGRALPARGEFLGVEWEMGHPCARYRHSLGQRDPNSLRNLNVSGQVINASNISEDVYFALDLRTVIKVDRTYTVDVRQTVQRQAPGGGAGGNSVKPGAGGIGAGSVGGPNGPQGLGAPGGGGPGSGEWMLPDGLPNLFLRLQRQDEDGALRGGGQRGNQGGPSRPGGQGGNMKPGAGGMGGAGGGRSGGSGNQVRIMRLTVSQQMILEK